METLELPGNTGHLLHTAILLNNAELDQIRKHWEAQLPNEQVDSGSSTLENQVCCSMLNYTGFCNMQVIPPICIVW